MKRTNEMQGRRLPDWEFTGGSNMPPMEPGDFMKVLNHIGETGPTNLTGEWWYVMTPNGLLGNLGNHTVREEDDGTISVKPGDGSSNSILARGPSYPEGWKPGDPGATMISWHGYITRGLWWSLA